MTTINVNIDGSILTVSGFDDITMSEDLGNCIIGIQSVISAFLFGGFYGMMQIDHRRDKAQYYGKHEYVRY